MFHTYFLYFFDSKIILVFDKNKYLGSSRGLFMYGNLLIFAVFKGLECTTGHINPNLLNFLRSYVTFNIRIVKESVFHENIHNLYDVYLSLS